MPPEKDEMDPLKQNINGMDRLKQDIKSIVNRNGWTIKKSKDMSR